MPGISSEGRSELAVVTSSEGIVTVDSAQAALGLPRQAVRERLVRWTNNGWLRRIRRDLYIPVPVEIVGPTTWSADAMFVADVIWGPCYFSGWTSANHWGLTEQVFIPTIVITTSPVNTSKQSLADNEYVLLHRDKSLLSWGMRIEWRQRRRLKLADPARTVIDMLDSPRIGGGMRAVSDVFSSYVEEHDLTTLLDYADRLGNRTVFKRMGYLASVLTPDAEEFARACREQISKGMSLLDPTLRAEGVYNTRWQLRINTRIVPSEAS